MTDQELARVLAEKAMGWTRLVDRAPAPAWWTKDGERIIKVRDWRPWENIAQAFEVVEAMDNDAKGYAKGWKLVLKRLRHSPATPVLWDCWDALFVRLLESAHARSDTPARAICLAAAKALGVEHE